MFSIIIATKDSEKWIEQTINSLIKQTYTEWECIFSLNGSSDSTKDICEKFCLIDKRFKIIEHNFANKSSALNRALNIIKFNWVCILDSDDLWLPNKLEYQKNFIKNNKNIDIIGTQMQYIDSKNIFLSNTPHLPIENDNIIGMLNKNINPIANSSVCYRKEIHDIVGFYDTECYVEDYNMWKKCKRFNLKFSNLNEVLMLHRVHAESNFNSTKKQDDSKKIVDFIDEIRENFRRQQ